MAQNIVNLDNYSRTAYYTVPKFNDIELSNATCFFYSYNAKDYIITNWHVVSGKNAQTGQLLSSTGAIPNKLSIRLFKIVGEFLDWEFYDIELLDSEGEPLWYEHKEHGRLIDVVVIPIDIPSEYEFYSINEVEEPHNEQTKAVVRQDVFVLGYPFGITGGGGLPIWKRASVASEPDIDIEGLPKMYIDTASRSGMSGSPVIIKDRRPVTLMSNGKVESRHYTKFLGVYSGRIGADDEFKAQLGLVWKEEALIDIIKLINE